MKLSDFIRGLEILQSYHEGSDGYHLGADHDELFAYATATPLSEAEVAEMKALGWFQPQALSDGEDSTDQTPYCPDKAWSAYV